MNNIMNIKEVPAFLHIPKNSGTYAIAVINRLFRHYIIKKHDINPKNIDNVLYRVQVKDKKYICFTLFLYDKDSLCLTDNRIRKNKKYKNIFDISIKNFEKLCSEKGESLSIFSLVVESYGTQYIRNNFLKNLESVFGIKFLWFTVLREEFFRQQSLYNYIRSKESKHELTHGRIKSETFEEYISSHECDCCWLIRSLSGNQTTEITEENFNAACDILNNFLIDKHTNITDILDIVFKRCYEITTDIISDLPEIYRHQTKYEKILMSDINPEILENFLKRANFENQIYKKYIKQED